MQKITPFLWFDGQAEEAAEFYTRTFKNAKILNVSRYGDAGAEASGMPKGTVMTVEFEIEGQRFVALNGGPEFNFTPAVSFMVECKTQEEIDYLWDTLSEGGEPNVCGWLTDRFGVSWQITAHFAAIDQSFRKESTMGFGDIDHNRRSAATMGDTMLA